MQNKRLSRRDFLRCAGLGMAALLVNNKSLRPAFTSVSDSMRPSLMPNKSLFGVSAAADPDVEIDMIATPALASILPGAATQVLTYQAKLVKGDASSLVSLPDNYLGPIIRVRQGQRLRVNFTNGLAEDTTVHFHGPCIPSHMGGHPHGVDVVHPGGKFIYEFDILDRAAPFWFHPHPDLRTGIQVYFGLAGLLLVTDDIEAQAGLDTGAYDVPLVIQDRSFDANNQFVYLSNGMGMGMGMMEGFMGDHILVNGKPDYVQRLAPGTYRLRLYNGSNARIYRLAWQDGTPFTIIGTDGGLLPKPVQRKDVMLAPAERLDLWVDFSGKPAGSEMVLVSLPFQSGMGGMMGGGMMGGGMMGGGMTGRGRMRGGMMGGGMMGGRSMLPHGAGFPVLKVRIESAFKSAITLPASLAGAAPFQLKDAVNAEGPRTIVLGMQHMLFTLNGRVFDMDEVAEDEKIPFDQLEVWEFVNQTMVAHPMHIHNVQFNVIERRMMMAINAGYQTVKQAIVDDGWKDTVLVMPGESVKLLVKFLTYSGMYMYHCHILEHEGMGMMRNLMVGEDPDAMDMSP